MQYTVKLQLRAIGDTIGATKPECTRTLELTNIKRDLLDDAVRYEIQHMLEEHFEAAVEICSSDAVDENEFGPLLSVRCSICGEAEATRLVDMVVCDEHGNYLPFPGQQAKQLVAEWVTARNECPEKEIYCTDAMFAEELGLPTLAALCSALDQITRASGKIDPEEAETILRRALSIALGEARERLRMVYNNESLDIPGTPTTPRMLLERRDQEIVAHERSSNEPEEFCAIDVVYPDAGEYKQFEHYVVEGELSLSQLKPYLEEGVYFVGRDVGIEDLVFRFVTRDRTVLLQYDHPWQEVLTVTQTSPKLASQAKEDGRFLGSAVELIQRFKRASEANWPSYGEIAEKIKNYACLDPQETNTQYIRPQL